MVGQSNPFLTPFISGGVAGLIVDVTLFPLDTLKTRLQSAQGFRKSGGFSGIYRGLGAVVAGSVPTAALFFLSYEAFKSTVEPLVDKKYHPFVHMTAASIAEVTACLIRVPVEVAKQRQQAIIGSYKNRSGINILMDAYRSEGFMRGVYRGFFSTVLRDLPFSLIQFPIWEYLKATFGRYSSTGKPSSIQVALSGSIAGAVAAAFTTPFDVAKTRIILAEKQTATQKLRVRTVLGSIYREAGIRGLFAGLMPRIAIFTLGGAVFFGAYDYSSVLCKQYL